jgi:hypothetical protein
MHGAVMKKRQQKVAKIMLETATWCAIKGKWGIADMWMKRVIHSVVKEEKRG